MDNLLDQTSKFIQLLISNVQQACTREVGLTVQKITAKQLAEVIRGALSNSMVSLNDQVYYITSIDTWKKIIALDWTARKKYLTDFFDCQVPDDLAFAYGLFFTDGSMTLNKKGTLSGASWRIVNANKDYLQRAKRGLDWEYKDYGIVFNINGYKSYQSGQETNFGKRKKTLYCLEPQMRRKKGVSYHGNRGRFIRDWYHMAYDPILRKKWIPKPIFDKEFHEPKRAFLEGVKAGNGTQNPSNKTPYISMGSNNRVACDHLEQILWMGNWDFKIRKMEKEWRFYVGKQNPPVPVLCDNFSDCFRAHASEIYNLNSAGMFHCQVTSDDGSLNKVGHRAVLICATDENDALAIYALESENGAFTKVVQGQPIRIPVFGTIWNYTPFDSSWN